MGSNPVVPTSQPPKIYAVKNKLVQNSNASLYPWQKKDDCVLFCIKLTPRAAHDRVQGILYDPKGQPFLKISVTAPPVDGRANKAVIQFLAKKMNIEPTMLSFVRGETNNYKVLKISRAGDTFNEAFLRKIFFP